MTKPPRLKGPALRGLIELAAAQEALGRPGCTDVPGWQLGGVQYGVRP